MTIISIFHLLSLLCFWILALIAEMYYVLRSFDGFFFFFFSKIEVPALFPVTNTKPDKGAFHQCCLLSCLSSFFFKILFIFLYSRFLLGTHFIHISVYMSILISQLAVFKTIVNKQR